MGGNMDAAQDIVFTISESVDYAGVALLMGKVEAFIDQCESRVQLRFTDIEVNNSLLVAMMMSWYRRAELAEKEITFHNLPLGLQKIIEISGLNGTLPIESL
ncbi:MAG: hypothetical protein KUG75_11820 [Pseudomonadales bacterium]|nr:hypothetical protein [Pseudomonadales bacterium]